MDITLYEKQKTYNMKRIKQTKFGPVEGNCFAACIA